MAKVSLGIYASAAASLVVAEPGPHSGVTSSALPPDLIQIDAPTKATKISGSASVTSGSTIGATASVIRASASETDNLPETGTLSATFSARAVVTANLVVTPMTGRWTRLDKTRYKELVVKWATSDLSQSEKQELDSLEAARSRFEDTRSPEEILTEFRTRELYANLLASLKDAAV